MFNKKKTRTRCVSLHCWRPVPVSIVAERRAPNVELSKLCEGMFAVVWGCVCRPCSSTMSIISRAKRVVDKQHTTISKWMARIWRFERNATNDDVDDECTALIMYLSLHPFGEGFGCSIIFVVQCARVAIAMESVYRSQESLNMYH